MPVTIPTATTILLSWLYSFESSLLIQSVLCFFLWQCWWWSSMIFITITITSSPPYTRGCIIIRSTSGRIFIVIILTVVVLLRQRFVLLSICVVCVLHLLPFIFSADDIADHYNCYYCFVTNVILLVIVPGWCCYSPATNTLPVFVCQRYHPVCPSSSTSSSLFIRYYFLLILYDNSMGGKVWMVVTGVIWHEAWGMIHHNRISHNVCAGCSGG